MVYYGTFYFVLQSIANLTLEQLRYNSIYWLQLKTSHFSSEVIKILTPACKNSSLSMERCMDQEYIPYALKQKEEEIRNKRGKLRTYLSVSQSEKKTSFHLVNDKMRLYFNSFQGYNSIYQ